MLCPTNWSCAYSVSSIQLASEAGEGRPAAAAEGGLQPLMPGRASPAHGASMEQPPGRPVLTGFLWQTTCCWLKEFKPI